MNILYTLFGVFVKELLQALRDYFSSSHVQTHALNTDNRYDDVTDVLDGMREDGNNPRP
jgi:hypothetical protein